MLAVSAVSVVVIVVLLLLLALVLVTLWRSKKTIDQAHVGVVTMFGKYRRTIPAGLNILIPFVEKVLWTIPVQNQTSKLEFVAITKDQASVHFTATLIFAVTDHDPETIQKVAFRFITPAAFTLAMTSAVEASVREFISSKLQADILGARTEIADHAKSRLRDQLADWGYTLGDLAINDITFDPAIMESMSRVVAAKNAQTAAEFEGAALLITRTKAAQAEGAFIRISAENEAEAARLRGKGLADFRAEITRGISDSAEMLRDGGIDPTLLMFTLWTETIRDAVKEGQGNVIFLDGGTAAAETTLKNLMGFMSRTPQSSTPPSTSYVTSTQTPPFGASTTETHQPPPADSSGA
ncbi:MAG: SPFH domain-containing protein [Acidimicrobiaceae bacterium]|nr:SPFH domain-containing protein [Acidimicrobiaceae bacterium]